MNPQWLAGNSWTGCLKQHNHLTFPPDNDLLDRLLKVIGTFLLSSRLICMRNHNGEQIEKHVCLIVITFVFIKFNIYSASTTSYFISYYTTEKLQDLSWNLLEPLLNLKFLKPRWLIVCVTHRARTSNLAWDPDWDCPQFHLLLKWLHCNTSGTHKQ